MTLRTKLTRELAEHFGWRPWREMSADRAALNMDVAKRGYSYDEPTRDCCHQAADDVLAIVAGYAAELAKEASEHPMGQVYAKAAIAQLKHEKG